MHIIITLIGGTKYSKVNQSIVIPFIIQSTLFATHMIDCQGMETSFLMSTILRIGSLMQVGFGSAGTEIIRSGLERGRHKGMMPFVLFSSIL
jgi:hypothetical protein